MCEYGPDVGRTKALVADLGIGANVVWLRKLRRKDILACLSLTDVAACEFAHSWLGGGVVFEAMALGKPAMQFRDDTLYQDAYPELPPIINARAPDEISNALNDIVDDRDRYRALGLQGRDWYQKFVVDACRSAFGKILETPSPADREDV
jgi:glycosyltransferase involved in cell wall biosynthesis